MRAGLATLAKMARLHGWRTLEERAETFTGALGVNLARIGAPVEIVQRASIFWLRLSSARPVRRVADIPEKQAAWYARFFHAALRHGVYLPPAGYEVCFVSLAHDDEILTHALGALTAAAEEAGAA